MQKKMIRIDEDSRVAFVNHADYCVGTGRMGLALTQEYQEQLALVQEKIGFSHIRGHGLFCDDMAIYQEYERDGVRHAEYNFTYLDRVMDSYQKLGIRPFLELGFMPEKLASGSQTVFYWKGNTTPPKSYEEWCRLVTATLSHLMDRYGEEEVITWPIEVWNEPNLPGFWENADMEEYFKLFEKTFLAIKKLDCRFRVGGPAICGVEDERWIRSFMEFCRERGLKPDFVTRHHYTTQLPKEDGHYGYAKLSEPEDGFANLATTRKIVDSFPEFAGMEIHITEFNTSYIPNCPLHDTNLNAAYIALQLSRLGDVNESYSYWTFGDVFEEKGVPFTPFHGGFGLVANGCIPKPTFWTFAFFKRLQGDCVCRNENLVIVRTKKGQYRGIAWNLCMEKAEDLSLEITLPAEEGSEWGAVYQTVDEIVCNPLKLWHDMGEPSGLTPEQKSLLQQGARPLYTSERRTTHKEGLALELSLCKNAVVYFEVTEIEGESDRGYCYERACLS